jgi:hypothetical protein
MIFTLIHSLVHANLKGGARLETAREHACISIDKKQRALLLYRVKNQTFFFRSIGHLLVVHRSYRV